MQSPYKRIIVYDLETGGLSSKWNSITELAMVVIDLETLEIIEEFSTMLLPRLDLSYRNEDPIREAKLLWKNLAVKNQETGIKTLLYKGVETTLKTIGQLAEDIEEFHINYLNKVGSNIIDFKDFEDIKRLGYKDILEIYFNHTYNPEALEVTKISKELILKEGVNQEKAFNNIVDLFERHTIGNSKPIISGHNIKKFDNPFFEKFFIDNGKDLNKYKNLTQEIDTLEWARLRWFEMPSYNLGTCANEFGLTLKDAHRALPDTVANAKFLIKMLQSFRGEGTQVSKYKRKKYNFNF